MSKRSDNPFQRAMKHLLAGRHIEADEIMYSLGHCQGDGASFTGRIDPVAMARLLARKDSRIAAAFHTAIHADTAVLKVTQSGRDVHEYSMDVIPDVRADIDIDAQQFDQLIQWLVAHVREAAREIERLGYALFDTFVARGQSVEMYRETIGTHTLIVECAGLADVDLGHLHFHDEDALIELLQEIDRAPHGAFVSGELRLRVEDGEGDDVDEKHGCYALFDTRDCIDDIRDHFDLKHYRSTYAPTPALEEDVTLPLPMAA
jgi:hypothetical protein